MDTRNRRSAHSTVVSPQRQSLLGSLKRELSENEPAHSDPRTPSKRPRSERDRRWEQEDMDVTLVEENEGDTQRASTPPTTRGQRSRGTMSVQRSLTPDKREPTRSGRFWYEDGSVVIQVGRVLFKLHKTLLSAQSSYFRDVFADPYQPPEDFDAGAGSTYPLHNLSIDGLRVFDFKRLLETLEDPLTITRDRGQLNMDFLGSVARAAHALKFEGIYTWAKDELSEFWPSSISRVAEQPKDCADDAMAALQLSIDADIPEIRKTAFYELLRLPSLGQDDEDVTPLRNADYKAIIRVRQYSTTLWMEVIAKLPPRSEDCKESENKSNKKSTCAARSRSQRYPRWFSFVEKHDLWKYCIDPIAGFGKLKELDYAGEGKDGFCFDCVVSWGDMWDKKKEQFWVKLDEVLGLASEIEIVE